jgi:phytoene/squalene synthetase
MMHLFHQVAHACSKITTETYSTSFSSAIQLLHKDLREPIYNIYGLVRFADEIVDTFHGHDKAVLLQQFKNETYYAIERRLSLNPILHSFQMAVNKFGIDERLIEAFFRSMEMDLYPQEYSKQQYEEYIYGSAEAVGLMCLHIFCEKDQELYHKLEPYARSLGAAFQKVNFLRDAKADFQLLDRSYFPGVDFTNFTSGMKKQVEDDINKDFRHAYEGILQLPWKARFGVYVAYKYYISLFRKIRKLHPARIMEERVRIPNYAKAMILVRAGVKNQLKMI